MVYEVKVITHEELLVCPDKLWNATSITLNFARRCLEEEDDIFENLRSTEIMIEVYVTCVNETSFFIVNFFGNFTAILS